MPQSNQTGEFNTFVGGLVTEASPLTFPENASIDEANFVLNKNGSRRRRLGMDYEEGLTPYDLSYNYSPISTPAISTYEWHNVAGIPGKTFIVCQIHDKVYIIDRADESLKSVSYVTHTIDLAQADAGFPTASFASVGGELIIAYGKPEVRVVTFVEGTETIPNTFPDRYERIKVRDLFGVEDEFIEEVDGVEVKKDLLAPEYINFRPVTEVAGTYYYQQTFIPGDGWLDEEDPDYVQPFRQYQFKFPWQTAGMSTVTVDGVGYSGTTTWFGPDKVVRFTIASSDLPLAGDAEIIITDNSHIISVIDEKQGAHVYNLRNQGWATPRLTDSLKADPIIEFEFDASGNHVGLPSNAETPVTSLMTIGSDPIEKFNAEAQQKFEPSKSRAAAGYFVIDLLERGPSREEEIERLNDIYKNANPAEVDPSISFRNSTIELPADTTLGGAKVVAEFAGRVWYGGFSSELEGGDQQSPNLSSYVFYSQTVKDTTQLTRCYQEGDPTGPEEPDIIETDGGFIRIAEAYNIQRMVDLEDALMVIGENGVWAVRGSDTGSFSATNQTVSKVTEHGTLSPQSVVVVEGTLMFWADDAIYHISRDEYGNFKSQELTVNIRSYYQGISPSEKLTCQGVYDSYEKKVRWMFNNTVDSSGVPTELVFDTTLAAFYPSEIGLLETGIAPIPVAPIIVSPYNIALTDANVVVGADQVVADEDIVTAETALLASGFRETSYLTLMNSADVYNTSFTFSSYRDGDFVDWFSTDGVGKDAPVRMITGYVGNGDVHRQKQVPYVYFHFLRTESGFTDDGDDLVPTNQSSCLVQAQWDWSNSASFGKWGREFQAYRYRRHYMPTGDTDTFDYGTTTIISRNKLRGRGRVMSFYIKSEPGKDLQLLGWSMTIGMNNNG